MEMQYGITSQNSVRDDFEFHLEEFFIQGYTIIPNFIEKDQIDILRSELQRIYLNQENQFTKEKLSLIKEENLARALLVESEAYKNLAAHPLAMSYVSKILGDYFILNLQNGIINMPNEIHHQSSWHRDLPYQNWVCSEPLACNVFYCLDRFDAETGATFLLPFSQKLSVMPSREYVNKYSIQINAKAGDIVIFDSMLFHKAGSNTSNEIRRGVNNVYTKPILKQQIDLPSALNGKYSEDSFLSKLFGYTSQIPQSVNEFRTKRVEKLN